MVGIKRRVVGADGGHLRAAGKVQRTNGGKVDVGGEVARREDDVFMRYALDIGAHPAQCLHAAAEASLGFRQPEGRQKPQSAGMPVEIPFPPAGEMVEQALIIPVHNDTEVTHTGVGHGGEHKVDEPIAPAKGDGGGVAVGHQCAKLRVGAQRIENALHIVHVCPSTSP